MRLALASAIYLVFALSPAVAAAGLPAGDYDAQLTGGTINPGGVLPDLQISGGSPAVIKVPSGADSPVALPTGGVNMASFSTQLICPTAVCGGEVPFPANLEPHLASLSASIDPLTGAATGAGAAWVRTTGTVLTVAFDCSFGSASSPIAVSLSTASPGGASWNPATGTFTLAGTAPQPLPLCTDSSLDPFAKTGLGLNGTEQIPVTLSGRITPRTPTVLRITSQRLLANPRGIAGVGLRCVSAPSRCVGRLDLSLPGSPRASAPRIASARFSIPAGAQKRLGIRVSRSVRRLLAAGNEVHLRALATLDGTTRPVSRRLVVQRRGG